MPHQSIGGLGEELMKRQLAEDPEQFKPKSFNLGLETYDSSTKPVDPHRLATIGGLADAASTYAFLKRGKAKESNALMGFAGGNPEATALGALGGLAASKGITALVNKFNPRLADALAANLGALQTSYAVGNLGLSRSGINSSRDYQNAMIHKVVKGQ